MAARTERVEVRLLPAQKSRIERAARIKGISVSQFLVQSAHEAAGRVLEENGCWVLTKEDSVFFANALLNPGEPSSGLKASWARYKAWREDAPLKAETSSKHP